MSISTYEHSFFKPKSLFIHLSLLHFSPSFSLLFNSFLHILYHFLSIICSLFNFSIPSLLLSIPISSILSKLNSLCSKLGAESKYNLTVIPGTMQAVLFGRVIFAAWMLLHDGCLKFFTYVKKGAAQRTPGPGSPLLPHQRSSSLLFSLLMGLGLKLSTIFHRL